MKGYFIELNVFLTYQLLRSCSGSKTVYLQFSKLISRVASSLNEENTFENNAGKFTQLHLNFFSLLVGRVGISLFQSELCRKLSLGCMYTTIVIVALRCKENFFV